MFETIAVQIISCSYISSYIRVHIFEEKKKDEQVTLFVILLKILNICLTAASFLLAIATRA